MRDFRRLQSPSPNGFNNKYLFPILGIFFMVAGLTLKVLALGLPWFALAINWIAKWTIILGIACLVPTIWRLFIGSQDGFKSSKYDLSCLKTCKFDQKLYSIGLFEQDSCDSNRILLPQVRVTDSGFKLSAIGGLRKLMLDDDTISDFNAYLSLNKANCTIRSAYYKDGYVHYVIGNSINHDRLRF